MYSLIILFNFLLYFLRLFRLFTFSYYLDTGYIDNTGDDYYQNYGHIIPEPTTITSWNIHGIPLYLTESKTYSIIEKLIELNSDVICIQECFCDELLQNIQNRTNHIYPFLLTGSLKKKYLFGENSGLVILSKIPIYYEMFRSYKISSGCDKFSNKGFLMATIGGLTIVNTHLQSEEMNFCCTKVNNIIEQQLEELKSYLPYEKAILTGDFNTQNLNQYFIFQVNNKRNTLNSRYFRHPQILDYIISEDKKYKINTKVIDLDNNPSDHKPIKANIIEN